MLIYPNAKIRLLIFLHRHNLEKFTYTDLKNLNLLNGCELSNFLKYCVKFKLVKRTETFWINTKKKKVYYEIKDNANIFCEWLDYLING